MDALDEALGRADHVCVAVPLTRDTRHLMNARRGAPAEGPLSVSTVARTGVLADAMSTTAFLVGPDRIRAFPEAREARFVA